MHHLELICLEYSTYRHNLTRRSFLGIKNQPSLKRIKVDDYMLEGDLVALKKEVNDHPNHLKFIVKLFKPF